MNNLLDLVEIIEITGMGRSTIYRLIGLGSFPKPLHVGPRRRKWLRTDVQTWLDGLAVEREGRAA